MEVILEFENDTLVQTPFLVRHPSLAAAYLTWLTIAAALGTLGNLLVIITVFTYRKLREVANDFIVNLAIADLIITSVINIFNISGIFVGPVMYESLPGLCEVIGFLCLMCCYCSLLSIGFIAVNRYVHICVQHRYSSIYTTKNTKAMCVVVWILAAIVPIAVLCGWGNYSFDPKAMTCLINRTSNYSLTLLWALTGVGFPVILICGCYLRIYIFIKSTRENFQPISCSVAENRKRQERRESTRLAKTLFLIFLALAVTWSPYAIVISYDFIDRLPMAVHSVAVYVAHLNSTLNPLIYAMNNAKFRKGFKVTLKRYLCNKYSQVEPMAQPVMENNVDVSIRYSCICLKGTRVAPQSQPASLETGTENIHLVGQIR